MPGRFYLSLGRRCLSLAMMASLALLFGGCGKPDGKAKGGDEHDHHHHHAHPTVGPHKGTILEWGGNHEHHIELVIDREKQQATVYFLDHDMKKTEPTALVNGEVRIIDAENSVQIPLVASPLDGETAEKSSRYVGTHAALGSKEPLTGDVRGQVGGVNYLESFEKIGGAKAGETKAGDTAAATPGDKKADGEKHDAHDGHERGAHEHDEHAHEAETKGTGEKEEHAHDEHAHDEHAHDEHAHDEHAHEEHGAEGKAAEPKKDGEQPKADTEKEHKHEEGHEHDHDAHDHDAHDHDHEHGADEKKPATDVALNG